MSRDAAGLGAKAEGERNSPVLARSGWTMLPNYTPVRLVTERYSSEGAPAGAVGTIIEVYDGAYEVEFSDPKTGISYAQIVAREEELEPQPEAESAPGVHRQRRALVLLADEREPWLSVLRLAAKILAEHGHWVEVLSDGQELLRRASAERPDVVVTGIWLAGCNVFQLARELRPLYGRGVCLVATTAAAAEVGGLVHAISPEALAAVDEILIRSIGSSEPLKGYIEQLVTTVEVLLARAQRESTAPP